VIPFYALALDVVFGAWLCSRGPIWQGLLSIAVGLIACRIALGNGLPMWASEPFDASDIGLIAFVGIWFAVQLGRMAA
jgi:hypothetical protein